MTLAISDDHVALSRVAASVVADRAPTSVVRADNRWRDSALWKEIVSLGWLGLHLPEEHGGQGFGAPELVIVLEQLGRSVGSGPFLPTVLASAVIASEGSPEQKQRWLPGLASGASTAGVAWRPGPDLTSGAEASIDGVSRFVLSADDADLHLLACGADLIIVRAENVQVTTSDAVDLLRPVVSVHADHAPVADVLPGAAATLRRWAAVLCSAEALGGIGWCAEASTEYAKVREQFDRVIGSFQAVKHQCVDLRVDLERSSATVWDAARDISDHTAAIACVTVLPAYVRVAEQTVQIHGGIAYTWEHDTHVFLRRALTLSALLDSPDGWSGQIVEQHADGAGRGVDLPPEAEALRAPVRAFAETAAGLPADESQRTWAHSGYLVPHWPQPYGRGADPVEQLVIEQELEHLTRPSLGLGTWVLPTLLQHGNDEQIERLMWPSLEGELRWCQLFSEPGAGSDAAAVSTRAQRVDGGWRVTGQKVWTSDARDCQRGLATVRTDPSAAKHRGITAMIIDLGDPGISIRPLVEMTGEALFNEVFFDDVFVPDADVVGDVNNGWSVAMATFGNERVSIGAGSVTLQATELIELLERHRPDDVSLRREVGLLLAEQHSLAMLNMRQAARAVAGAPGGVEGTIAKLFGAEHAQRVVGLGMRIAGAAAVAGDEPQLVHDHLFARCLTIAGGTSEVLRNLIGERILRLPKEPSVTGAAR